MEDRILVFAFNSDSRVSPDSNLKGYFDGEKFIPRERGFCNSIQELYEFEYVQLFGKLGYKSHIPKEYFGDLLQRMRWAFADEFGRDEQISLFG